jgi:hypothetical protein
MGVTDGGDASSSMCGKSTRDDAQSFPQRIARPYHTAVFNGRGVRGWSVALDGAQQPAAEVSGCKRSGFVFFVFRESACHQCPRRGAGAQSRVRKEYLESRGAGQVVCAVANVYDEGRARFLLQQLDDADRAQQPKRVGAVAGLWRCSSRQARPVTAPSAGDAGGAWRAQATESAPGERDRLDAALVAMRLAEHPRGGLGAGEARGQVRARTSRAEEQWRGWLAATDGEVSVGALGDAEVVAVERVSGARVDASALVQGFAGWRGVVFEHGGRWPLLPSNGGRCLESTSTATTTTSSPTAGKKKRRRDGITGVRA